MSFIINPYAFAAPNWLLNNLVSYYKFDTNWSFPDAHWSNDWTINGATFTASWKINWAYSFDWTNDWIDLPAWTNDPWTWDVSIAFWYKSTQTATNREIYANTVTATNHIRIGHNFTAWKLQVYFFDGTNQDSIASNTTINDWSWHYIVVTRDTTAWKGYIYIDWSEDKNFTNTATGSLTNTDAESIWYRNSASYFGGEADELWIWHRALSADDVTTLYNDWNGLWYPNFTS